MLTIHHLSASQSDRIVWLAEELGIPYHLKWYNRDADGLAPADYRELHPAASAPIISDGDTVLCESQAIVEYIIQRYGNGRMAIAADQPEYPDYLYWMCFAGSLLATISANIVYKGCALESDMAKLHGRLMADRETRYLAHMNQRLGTVPFLAGETFTGADIMNFFNLSTMPAYGGPSLEPYPSITAYADRISHRPAYRKAMAIAGPGASQPAKN